MYVGSQPATAYNWAAAKSVRRRWLCRLEFRLLPFFSWSSQFPYSTLVSPVQAKNKKKQALPDIVLNAQRVYVVIRPLQGGSQRKPARVQHDVRQSLLLLVFSLSWGRSKSRREIERAKRRREVIGIRAEQPPPANACCRSLIIGPRQVARQRHICIHGLFCSVCD